MTDPRAKEEFLEWIAYLRLQTDDVNTIRGIDEIRDRGLEMYDEFYIYPREVAVLEGPEDGD